MNAAFAAEYNRPYKQLRYGVSWNLSTKVSVVAEKGIALDCEGSHFYLGAALFPAYVVLMSSTLGTGLSVRSLLLT